MDIQKALVRIGACESYLEAAKMLVSGKVKLNERRIDHPWYRLKGGYYVIKIESTAVYRFNIRQGKVGVVRTERILK